MNTPSALRRTTRTLRSLRPFSSSSSTSSKSTYPPSKSDGRRLSSSTLRSLISLHHSSAGFLHDPKDLTTGFDNTFRYTTEEPYYRSFNDTHTTAQTNAQMTPPGGLENLVEKPKCSEARGLDFRRGRTLREVEGVSLTFKETYDIWSERDGHRGGRGGDEQFLTDRELRVQEALYGTWERGGQGMGSRVQPGLDGVLEFVDAKGKSVREYAEEWKNRDKGEGQ
ncbi:hypothetical protein I302_104815 [Kwoniella bestiolae CBS 10118]|uniref:Uncharacterized protein n=1 Tax=Kwoniella bestiolae CBS 10118 TaxID=1296100 RepID=A0A1B9FRN7_9TREE|nr:hypothetical protein I302_09116 [Kwoniella bestiolae CBS 10118]OCF21437.1 hypothetical protein I302_09116 [Kwoniella bestiolae CBS 10118]